MSSDSNYEKLSDELQNKINTELFDGNGFKDNAIRRIDKEHDRATLWRPAFVRDVEKIMHSPYYNRYADKTQVFSFIKMMIFHTVHCTFSLFQELREI